MNRDGTQDFSKPICQPRNDVRACVDIVVVGSAAAGRVDKAKPPEPEKKKDAVVVRAAPSGIVF